MGNASWFELVIWVILLIGTLAVFWLEWQCRLDERALNRQKITNGRRYGAKVEKWRERGNCIVIGLLFSVATIYALFVPEPQQREVAMARLIGQVISAFIVLSLVGPSLYALHHRRKQMAGHMQERDGLTDRRKEQM